jgi:diguanylate cyclase (GGDEF)-like protein
MPTSSAVRALADAWWRRCQLHRCASGRADADERELLVGALAAAAGGRPGALELFERPLLDFSPSTRASDAGEPVDEARQAATRLPGGLLVERRRTLAATANRWGARVGSPEVAIAQLVQLRLIVTVGEKRHRAVDRLVDLMMVNACHGATDELQRASFTDPLTACPNRRAFERDLERELARCARAELDLSLVAIDVDGLKEINDSQGHAAGDRCLVRLVDTLRLALRSMDCVYRLGGDEFGLVLPDTSIDDAAVVVTRALRLGAPSFSWGSASYQSSGNADVAELSAAADAELYARRRRDRISVHVPRQGLQHASTPAEGDPAQTSGQG